MPLGLTLIVCDNQLRSMLIIAMPPWILQQAVGSFSGS